MKEKGHHEDDKVNRGDKDNKPTSLREKLLKRFGELRRMEAAAYNPYRDRLPPPPPFTIDALFRRLLKRGFYRSEARKELTSRLKSGWYDATPPLPPTWRLEDGPQDELFVVTPDDVIDARAFRLSQRKQPYIPHPTVSFEELFRQLIAQGLTPAAAVEKLDPQLHSFEVEVTPECPAPLRLHLTEAGDLFVETTDGTADASQVFARKREMLELHVPSPADMVAFYAKNAAAPPEPEPALQAQSGPAGDSTVVGKKGRKPHEVVSKVTRDAAVRAMIEAGAGYEPNDKKPRTVARKLLGLGLFPAYTNPEMLAQAFKRNHLRLRRDIERAKKMAASDRSAAKVSDATPLLTPKLSDLTQIFKPKRTPKT